MGLWRQIRDLDRAYWVCIVMELLERMAYYGVRLVVPVFLVLAPSEGGPGLSHGEKGQILAMWAAMQSWLPTFTGGFSDRYGYKRTIALAVVLKTSGYAAMAFADGYWTMLLGTQLLAAGTGLFKPGIQGTMAHSIAKSPGNESMGWGLFYQAVNIGAGVSAYIPMFTRDVFGWHSVFAACSGIVFCNFGLLLLYEEPHDERQTAVDTRGPGQLVVESVRELFTSPILLGFVLISAGFWFAFHQIFDMLPNYVDDWTDSSRLYAFGADLTGSEAWAAAAAAGQNVPQERILNLNSLLIMTTMFLFAWLTSRIRALTSTTIGIFVASLALLPLLWSAEVGVVLAAITIFTVGEMLASPKKQEYLGSLAPPGKRALYLGYANLPDGIGWVLGSLVAGAIYETDGDKVNLSRGFYAEHATIEDARAFVARVPGLPEEAREEVAERAEERLGAGVSLAGVPDDQLVAVVADVLPRGLALDEVVAAVPVLPDGTPSSPTALRDHLYETRHPGQVWTLFLVMGLISGTAMIGYDAFVRRRIVPGLPSEPTPLA
jgi:dipeptide/tripeptide permease